MLNLPFLIARHYLAQQKGAFSFITRLAVVATALSIAVMIVSLAVVAGFETTVKEKLYSFSGHVHITRFDAAPTLTRTSPPIYADPQLLSGLQKLPHVRQAVYFAERPVILQYNHNMEGLELKGIPSNYHFPASIALKGTFVHFPDSGYSREVLVSDGTAQRLNIAVGDTAQLAFFEAGSTPRLRLVRIAGIYHSGMDEVDRHYMIADIRLIQRLNNWPADSVNACQIDLDDERYADTTATLIHYNLIAPPLEVLTTAQNYSAIMDWLNIQTVYSQILLAIMAIVAIINMGAVLVILIVDRTAMLGLLKALGMTYNNTVLIFLNMGALIGGAGIVLGNVLGIGLCLLQQHFKWIRLNEEIYYMKYAPIKIVWWQVGLTDLGCLILLTCCMWLPALYIRTIQPAKALQFR